MQPHLIELDLQTPDNADLLKRLLKEAVYSGKLALLVGSAISQFVPSNIPMASDISYQLRALVINRFSPYTPREDLEWGISGMPFEIFMSRLVEFAGLDLAEEFISKLITMRKPNPVHLQIGRLVDMCNTQGINLTVVTTNYDLGIEYGSRMKLKPVVEEKDIDETSNNSVCLFKPHGSLGMKGSLVLDAEREYKLAPWKHDFLCAHLNGKTLVVLGYSGWDLDISLALNDCGLERVIWCCYETRDANTEHWSPGKRKLMIDGKSRYKLILNPSKTKIQQRNVLKVLESISPGVRYIRCDRRVLQTRLLLALRTLPQGIEDAWLAWIITRAGYGHIGMTVKDVVDRTPMISKARQIEYEATCYFYQGKHKTAALLERAAASAFRNDPHERSYHRTNEAGYWNRGQYSIMAVIAIVRGLLELHFQSYKHDEFDSDTTYVRDQAMQIWPFQWMRGSSLGRRVARAIVRLGEKSRTFDEQANLDRAAYVGTGGTSEELTKWRYIWFGQNARLVNYQRIEARIELDRFRQYRRSSDFKNALQLVLDSALGSRRVGDPARLGKAHLLLAELAFEGHKSGLPFPNDLLRQMDVNGVSWEELGHNSARKGWQEIQASQTWFISVWPGMWLYSLTNGLLDKVIRKSMSSNLMSIASRWVGA